MNLIVCIAKNNAIGRNNGLLYHLRADLQQFKKLTTGHTVIMGRRTYESLPKGALPNRRNIVLTRQNLQLPGCDVYASLADALDSVAVGEEVFIMGGASVYAEALPLVERLYLTSVDDTPADADTFFPTLDLNEWTETAREEHPADDQNDRPFAFITLERQTSDGTE